MDTTRIITLTILCTVLSCCCQAQERSINQYLDAVGGRAKWKALSTLITEYSSEYQTAPTGDFILPSSVTENHTRAVSKTPDHFKLEIVGIGKPKYTLIYDGEKLMELFEGGQLSEAPDYIIREYKKRSFHLGEPWIVLNAEQVKYLRNEIVDQIDCSVYSVTRLGLERLFYIRNDDHLLYMTSMFGGQTITYFSDYQNVDGYGVPFRSRGFVNGKLEIESFIKSINFNPVIPDSEFSF